MTLIFLIELVCNVVNHEYKHIVVNCIFLMWCLVVYYAIKRKLKNATPNK